MNETIHPNSASDSPWFEGEHLAAEPETPTLPSSEEAEPAAVDTLKSAAQGAHHTIDRLADSAAPAVQQLGESASAVEDALLAKADQFRETRDEWAENVRTTVRANPLAAIAAAVMLGAVIARITR